MQKVLLFCGIAFSMIFAQGAKDYMQIEKSDFISGVIKIDINFNSGANDGGFGIFVNEDYIVTSDFSKDLGYPSDINIKLIDDDLLICIAKARLISSNANLSLLKITHYTDDYCNTSSPKNYHKELISMQIIDRLKPQRLESGSPFLLNNAKKAQVYQQGFPYFNENGLFVGIFSNGKIINAKQIYQFAESHKIF